ncbi:hypothetical protein V495_08487 [Pseudogymnoascus sp. VKM F-4514 (FW-929)]|nr:hypothetical protein V495_08487 [Pseudogymnoascus sp. VKM F-4514 (FW-929)]KFY51472.1 hypothetical protein V497_09113 [Pseudogymnoascus sp. VKM F-4516 (FW-969)]
MFNTYLKFLVGIYYGGGIEATLVVNSPNTIWSFSSQQHLPWPTLAWTALSKDKADKMPSYRGVTLSITSALDSKVYPEFPHPETSRFQNVGSSTLSDNNTKSTSSSPNQEAPGSNSFDSSNDCISVYIPSLPGTRFVVQYAIDPPHTDGTNVFLKLSMNGRHVTSWGIDPRTMPVGRAMLGLFEADKKLKSKALIPNPAETKPFYFNDQKRDLSAAENGGVIEVRVFRACGKRRRGAILDAFRGQDNYGIEFKSSGLLEKSRYKYFDWLLEDPKDDPFVTFRFHYRSWDSLEALQLIPEMCSRELLPAFSIKDSLGAPSLSEDEPILSSSEIVNSFRKSTSSKGSDGRNRSTSHGSALSTKNIENTIFGQMVAKDTASSQVRSQQTTQTDVDKPKKKYQIPTSTFSISNNERWKSQEYLPLDIRPLPELPTGNSHSRKSSASSMAFSIAPSLRSWADGDWSDSHEPVICVAAEAQVLRSPQVNKYGRQKSIFDDDDDDSTTSSASGHSDAHGDIDQSFQLSLSAPPVYEKKSTSPVKKSRAQGLALPASAIFPPPALRRDRMRRIRFKGQKRGSNSPTQGYDADHEGLNSYRGSSSLNTRGLPANLNISHVPPRLLAVNSGFSFEYPFTDETMTKSIGDVTPGTESGNSEDRIGEALFQQNRGKK